MSHSITYFPRVLKANGRFKHWVPELGHFIGNDHAATQAANKLRGELKTARPEATVRRFGGHVNVYM